MLCDFDHSLGRVTQVLQTKALLPRWDDGTSYFSWKYECSSSRGIDTCIPQSVFTPSSLEASKIVVVSLIRG